VCRLACLILTTASLPLTAAVHPPPVEGDYVIERAGGRPVVIPFGEHTRGHGSHTIAVSWKQYLQELLQESE